MKELNITQCEEIQSLEGIGNREISLTYELELLKIENFERYRRIRESSSDNNCECRFLKNVDALSNLPKLETFKLHSCGIKKAELPKELQVIVETRTSWEDWG